MSIKDIIPEFIIVGDDPIVVMDIIELVHHEFQKLAVCIDTIDELAAVIGTLAGHAVVIAGCDPVSYIKSVHSKLAGREDIAVVLIASDVEEDMPLPERASLIQSPFSSDTLLASIRSAIANLHSARS